MCPGVFNSCCLKEDQLRIFSNWVHSRERASIKRHFQDVGNVYYNMMLEYKKISEMARHTIQTLSYKKIANCKVLAQRILLFDIESLVDQIQTNFRLMEETLFTSYKGFYCSICNYNMQEFFDIKGRTVQYSEKFCRDLVTSSLSTLLFYYNDIVKYNNLVSKFLLSCDKNGEFEADIQIPEDVVFIFEE